MKWPLYFLDLNPIEHCWFPLKEGAYGAHDGELGSVKGQENIKACALQGAHMRLG
jgi:hypothetical protein